MKRVERPMLRKMVVLGSAYSFLMADLIVISLDSWINSVKIISDSQKDKYRAGYIFKSKKCWKLYLFFPCKG
jgi:hypothetical protein